MKSLKSAIIDWLMPPGKSLIPPLLQNIKDNHSFNHEIMGSLLCPAGVDWADREQVKFHALIPQPVA
jgi:hypothetical protein